MDDRSGAERGPSEFADAHEDDPFAELAKLIEEPWGAPVAKPAPKAEPVSDVAEPQPEPVFESVVGDERMLDEGDSPAESVANDVTLETASSDEDTVAEESPAAAEPEMAVSEIDSEEFSSLEGDLSGIEDAIAEELAEPVEAAEEPVAAHQLASELKPAHQELLAAEDAVAIDVPSKDEQDFGLDGLIASELDAELASFADDLETEAAEPAAEAVAPVEPVAPAKPAARPYFGAAMFSQHPASTSAKPQPTQVEEPVLEPLAMTSEKNSEATPADDGFDAEFAMALEGLSAPADPLAGKVRKTEAFAPERKVEEEKVESVFDDFDTLLASEMATLNLDKTAQATAEAEADQPEPAVTEAEPAAAEHDSIDEEPLPRILSTFSANAEAAEARYATRSGRFENGLPYRKIAAGLFGVALLSGASMFVLGGSGEGSGSSEPLIVKADADPVKIAPPNPGGRQVANQHRATYEKVANADADGGAPQESLLSAAEKPINLQQEAPESYENLPGVQSSAFAVAMSDTKPASAEPTLQPRRVRTVTVLPDGTIVTNKETESIEPTKALIEAASRPLDARQTLGGIASASSDHATNGQATLAGSADLAAIEAMANGSASDEAAADTPELVGEPAPNVPVPSMKPNVSQRPQQVASLQSAEQTASIAAPSPATVSAAESAPAPGSDAWYVQLSSQPNAEAAKASAQTASSRYGNIISGRQMVIQTADIPGKGTYHRVRLAASSKQEAIDLCEQMKSAGGSCYVSR
ncbi:SPOR domain-containing protein [Fulvimarina sp. MAC8]|uniref:SPOR domain-containing protein n=1 Tax=Fulvimarina sp. MAC8 TaxID=3162874 RepID=UPI0032EC675E